MRVRMLVLALITGLASALAVPQAGLAADIKAQAAHLSDQAFELLNSVNSMGSKEGVNPLAAPAAALAADAQALSSALARGDNAAASASMAAIVADRKRLDAAAAAHPKMLKPARTQALDRAIDALAKQVGTGATISSVPTESGAAPTAAGATLAPGASPVPAAPSAPALALGTTEAEGAAPVVKIQSRRIEADLVHITGYFAGENLKSAGIYANGREIENLKIGNVIGKEKVDFDLRERLIPGEELRVYNEAGQSTGLRFVPLSAHPPGPRTTIGGFTPPPVRSGPPTASGEGNTEEIPSRSPSRKGIARNRGGLRGTGLTGVQIQVIAVTPSSAMADGYEVIGQIAGGGIRRAGIYVDGRLVKPIPLSSGGAGYADFDVIFPMVGHRATIRAYGAGSNYVEASIDLSNEIPGYKNLFPPGSPFRPGANPYAGGAPYARSPYGAPYPPPGTPFSNPYGGYRNSYPTPVPFWRHLLPF